MKFSHILFAALLVSIKAQETADEPVPQTNDEVVPETNDEPVPQTNDYVEEEDGPATNDYVEEEEGPATNDYVEEPVPELASSNATDSEGEDHSSSDDSSSASAIFKGSYIVGAGSVVSYLLF